MGLHRSDFPPYRPAGPPVLGSRRLGADNRYARRTRACSSRLQACFKPDRTRNREIKRLKASNAMLIPKPLTTDTSYSKIWDKIPTPGRTGPIGETSSEAMRLTPRSDRQSR